MNLITTLMRRSGLGRPLLLFFFLIPFLTWAQSDTATTYDYSQFRFPDINRKALDFSGSFGGRINDNRLRESGATDERGSLGQNLDVRYSQFINRDKLQATRDIFLSNSFDFSSTKDVVSNVSTFSRESRLSPSLSSFGVNRYYFQPNRYVQLDWNFFSSYSRWATESSSITIIGAPAGLNPLRWIFSGLIVPTFFSIAR